jgi:NTP pyrophosphatase (non-canonical NTP hydrolase)
MPKPARRPDVDSVSALQGAVCRFIAEREWDPFHTPKNISMGIAIEAAELMEHFQWSSPEESVAKVRDPEWREEIEEEIADVAIFALRFAEISGIDLGEAVLAKLVKNAKKYPVELVKGKPHKYPYYRRLAKKAKKS